MHILVEKSSTTETGWKASDPEKYKAKKTDGGQQQQQHLTHYHFGDSANGMGVQGSAAQITKNNITYFYIKQYRSLE